MHIIKYLVSPFAIALTLIVSVASLAEDEIPMFTTPPSAQELADIMFPQRTRSIVINDEQAVAGAGSAASSNESTAKNEVQTSSNLPTVPLATSDTSATAAFGLLINFNYGRATVTSESLGYLDAVGEMLNLSQADNRAILIEGHTDAVGSHAYNQDLSERRALAVQRYLVSAHRIDVKRLHPVGVGENSLHNERNPKAAINRRVEFRLLERNDS